MTSGLRPTWGDDELTSSIVEAVRRRVAADRLADVVVVTDGDFRSEDNDVVEVRVIVAKGRIAPQDMTALRNDLFDLVAATDSNLIPMLRFISEAEYREALP